MSTCISRHGEFGSHELDEQHTCTLCHVLDEDALRADLASVRAERDELNKLLANANEVAEFCYQANERLTVERDDLSRNLFMTNEENERLSGEVWQRTEERDQARARMMELYGDLTEARNQNEMVEAWGGQQQDLRIGLANKLHWHQGQLQNLRGLCDGIMRFGGTEADSSVTVKAIREIIEAQPSSQVAPIISQPWELGEELKAHPLHVVCGRCGGFDGTHTRRGCEEKEARAEADAVISRVVDAYDNQLEHINRRVEADREVFAAAESLVEQWKQNWVGAEDSDAGMFLDDRQLRLYAAVRVREGLGTSAEAVGTDG